MKRTHTLTIALIFCLILPMLMVALPLSEESVVLDVQTPKSNSATLAEDGSVGPLITNTINNPSFEERYSYGTPTDYSWFGSYEGIVNRSYQGLTHAGSYAGWITGAGSSSASAYPAASQTFSSNYLYMLEGPELEFYWYVQEAGAIDQGSYVYLYVETVNSSWDYQSLYYILCHDSYNPNNNTNNAYFLMNESILQWNHYQRNLTEDFLDYFSSYDSSRRVNGIYFYSSVPIRVREHTTWVIDDVSMLNGTGYQYVQNGDFESGGFWSNYVYSPAEILTSTDSTHGTYSLNMSISSIAAGSSGYAGFYESQSYPTEGFYPTGPRTHVIEFDWKYSGIENDGGSYAYFRLRGRNETGSYYWYHYLGRSYDSLPGSNTTTNWYTKDPAFGSWGSWQHTVLDVYKLYQDADWMDLAVTGWRFYIGLGSYANASMELLVDDFQVLASPTGDGGFEITTWDGYRPPFGTWYLETGDTSIVQRSTESHSGNYAANISVSNDETGAISREDFETPIVPSMYTDFWCNISEMSSGASSVAYARYYLQFNHSYGLYYYPVRTSNLVLSNSSNYAHIMLDDLNTTGIWLNAERNLTADLVESFGDYTYYLNRVDLQVYADIGESLTVLFDDVGFTDMVPPEISSTTLNPTTPVYHQSTEVTATVIDQLSGVYSVELYYRTSGDWNKVEATAAGSTYTASIPIFSFGTSVEYYINATDWTGTSATYSGSFVVGDDIDPTVSVSGIEEDDIVSGGVLISATAEDVGSDIDYVEFQVDGGMVYQDDESPYEHLLLFWPYANGSHTVSVVAHDNGGNTATVTYNVDVQNDVAGPVLTSPIVNPSEPRYDQTTTIYVGASDASEIKNLTIHYRTNGGTFSHELMIDMGGSLYSFSAELSYDDLFEYYIVAYDNTPNEYNSSLGSEGTPLSFVVGDPIAPMLGVSGPSSLDIVRDTVTFIISAEDEGSGIDSIEFYVDDTLVTSTTSDVLLWDTLSHSNGNHTLTFIAIDNAGNTAEISLEYQVSNPEGIGVIGDTFDNLMAEYGFFIGAGTIILVIIIGKILLNRRKK